MTLLSEIRERHNGCLRGEGYSHADCLIDINALLDHIEELEKKNSEMHRRAQKAEGLLLSHKQWGHRVWIQQRYEAAAEQRFEERKEQHLAAYKRDSRKTMAKQRDRIAELEQQVRELEAGDS